MAAFTVFKSNVLRLSVENTGNDGGHYISLQVYNFSRSSKCFRRSVDKVLPLGSLASSSIEILSVKCLLNASWGLYQPCLLLRQALIKSASREEFNVLLLEDYDSVSLLGSFEVSHTGTDIEFHLCDGPSVCWALEGTAYCARYNTTLEKFTVDSLAADDLMNEQLGIEFNLLWCGLISGQVVAMGAKLHLTDATLPPRWTCVNHSNSNIQEIALVPNVYVSIATCCFVREVNQEVATSRTSDSIYDGLEIFLTTNQGQLLKFASGRLKSCWQLPFTDAERIWIIESVPDDVTVMVASHTKNVCAVNCISKKVVKEWHEIEVILIDDFLEKGDEQVLFFPKSFNMSENEELSGFSLIDVRKGMSSIKSTQDSSQSQSVTGSLQKAAQALRTRFQARASTLYEAKLECHEKLKMVENCCKVLKNMTSSCDPMAEDKREKYPGLFCLLEGALDEGEKNSSPKKLLSSSPNVKEIWQRIVSDQWIVGVDVENTSERTMSDLVLGLVSCQSESITYTSKTVFCSDDSRQHKKPDVLSNLETDNNTKSSSMKRKRTENSNSTVNQKLLPGNLTRLTAVTSLPRLTYKDSCSLSVVVTWTSYCDRHSMHCGHVTIDTEQIVNGSLNLKSHLDNKSVQQDIAALRSVSVETELILQSRFSQPHQLILLVKNSVRDVPVLQAETSEHQNIFSHLLPVLCDTGPLGGAAIVLKDDLKEGQVTLLTGNKNQVFPLQHRLRQVLPDDVRILANPAFDLSAIKDSLCALNHEATNLQHNLYKLMEKTSRPTDFDTNEKSNHKCKDDSIKTLRDRFERKREREIRGREEISSERGDLARLWSEFVQDQISTDTAIANT